MFIGVRQSGHHHNLLDSVVRFAYNWTLADWQRMANEQLDIDASRTVW